MKYFLFVFIALITLASCKSNTKQPITDSTATAEADPTKELITTLKPIIQGVWVKSDYIDKLLKTKSPLDASDLANGMTTMVLDTDKINGDSLVVSVGWSNHEGSELTLKFKPGKEKSSVLFGTGDLVYSVKNGDTTLTTYWPDDNTKKIIATHYKRALVKTDDNLSSGTDYMVNKGLVAGNYTVTDSTGKTSKVTLKTNGTINGFSPFKNYMINIDLNVDVLNNLDEIIFDVYKKNQKSYTFKINADTLKLYDTRPNADSTLLILDKLKYTLIKQK